MACGGMLEKVVLGALLHDIGKFGQRARAPRSEEMISTYCPTNKATGKPGYLHVLYTDYFIEYDLPLPKELQAYRSVLAKIASSHHLPDDTLESLSIAVADWLASGLERMGTESGEGGFRKTPLKPIFSEVSLTSDDKKGEELSYQLRKLEEDPFPVPWKEVEEDYPTFYESFRYEVAKIDRNETFNHYLGSLSSILENYTWCIPSSSYKAVPDVSLFDHLWGTAAIAQALYAYHTEEGGLPDINDREKKFILFAGDLSGIQSYILGVEKSHSRGVAKLFRARSFYLQMLTRSVIIEILDRLGLYPVAKIMDAGGKFFLLLPNTKKTRQTLYEIDGEIQKFFHRQFKGELSLNCLRDFTLTQQDLTLERFPEVYEDLIDQLEAQKLKKFHGLMKKENFSPIFQLNYNEYQEGNCVVCKRNAANREMDGLRLCEECDLQINVVGKRLPNDNFKYITFEKGRAGEGSVPLFGDISMSFHDRPPEGDFLEIVNLRGYDRFYHHAVAGYIPKVTSEDINRWRLDPKLYEALMEENGGEIVEGMPKTFSMIAQKAQRQSEDGFEGKDFLAAFKADVDNLGLIFSIGLLGRDKKEPSALTISRLASLSRMLNHFFSDYLVGFIEKKYPDLYLIFAGGDDLFLIGPWVDVLDFAQELTAEFRRYVGGNPDIHLSAGIALAKHRYPVRSLAEVVEEQLERSKNFGEGTKNAFTFLGVTAGWDVYPRLLEKGKWLDDLVNKSGNKKVPVGFVNRLLRYARMYRDFMSDKESKLRAGLYKSLMRYDIARNMQEHPERKTFEEMAGDEFWMSHLEFPASYALYRNRK